MRTVTFEFKFGEKIMCKLAVSFPVQTKTWLHPNSVKSESSAFRPEKRLKVFARNGWD